MTATERAKEAFDTFFNDNSLKVLVFKGPWGSGKSHFARKYLASKNTSVPSLQYYVSLFGLSTLQEVKEAINASLSIRPTSGGKAKEAILNAGIGAGKIAKALEKLPTVHGLAVGAVGQSLFWLMTREAESVVVFDDLERAILSKHLIFGLASNLAENTKAKIVIIFNEDQIKDQDDIKQLNTYREKVVDVEIEFLPSVKTLVDEYLEEKSIADEVVSILESVDVKNIRIIFKINLYLALFKQTAGKINVSPDRDELIKAAKIVCFRFLSEEPITLGMVESGFFGRSFSKDKNEEESSLEKLNRKLRMFPPYSLDGMVFELVQSGYCTDESIEKYRAKHTDIQVRNKANEDIKAAYEKWGSNFSAPIEQVFADIEKFMNVYAGNITNEQFVATLRLLSTLDYPGETESWKKRQLKVIDMYERREEKISQANTLLPSQVVEEYIASLKSQKRPPSDPTTLIRRIIKSRSWHPDDYEEMNLMTEQQVFDWISTSTDSRFIDLLKDIRKTWGGTDAPSAVKFCKKIDKALAKLAARSSLDKARVKVFFGME